MKVAVLGFGLIGRERFSALLRLRDREKLVSEIAVFDPFAHGAREEVEKSGGWWYDSFNRVMENSPELFVVATPHDTAVELVEKLLPAGFRVHMEKPFGRNLEEAKRLSRLIQFERQLTVGFNYRFFPGVSALLHDAHSGWFGPLLSVNMVLGHGGSPGMEKDWKFNPVKAGGGCLIDPGVHLLDLCHTIAGSEIKPVAGSKWQGFWNTGIEEEVHLILKGTGNLLINLQVSIVRWRSNFKMEINGVEGYGIVEGRGRSYGPQSYRRGKRWGWSKAKNQEESEEHVCISDCQNSFLDELRDVIQNNQSDILVRPCSGKEALAVMQTYSESLNLL